MIVDGMKLGHVFLRPDGQWCACSLTHILGLANLRRDAADKVVRATFPRGLQ